MLKHIGTGLMSFSDFLEKNSYYVDKTFAIKEIFDNGKTCCLFTRPRRFGKTLIQSMLKEFLCLNYKNRPDHDERLRTLFKGLAVAADQKFCEEHMGRHPVIYISFKNVEQNTYDGMRLGLIRLVRELYASFYFLAGSKKLNRLQLQAFDEIAFINGRDLGAYTDELITASLGTLCSVVNTVYDRKAVVLIDEYDVPLNKAHSYGFYEKILPLFREMLYKVVKDDRDLVEKCVLTGCLRISRESIFTGMNNAGIYTMSDPLYADVFGFTQSEVDALLEYYSLSSKKDIIKQWYNGYNFKGTSIYNPWDVLCYCDALLSDPKAQPGNFWSNTSGNDIIKEFIDYAERDAIEKMQKLLNGETVKVKIDEYLAYPQLEKEHSEIQLFSILFSTGYLTAVSVVADEYELKIPNKEIMQLFKGLVAAFYQDPYTSFHAKAKEMISIMKDGYPTPVANCIALLLSKYLSFRDVGYEIAYHSYILGILSQVLPESSGLSSEIQAGDGIADIAFSIEKNTGIILELKRAGDEKEDLPALAHKALKQAEDRKYYKVFSGSPVDKVIIYGIACFKRKVEVTSKTITRMRS